MYRTIVMFPTTTEPSVVDDLVEGAAAVFKQCAGFRSITVSVNALMGPSARSGEIGRVLEADFDTLDDVMAVLGAESFQEVRAATEAVAHTLLIYELVEL